MLIFPIALSTDIANDFRSILENTLHTAYSYYSYFINLIQLAALIWIVLGFILWLTTYDDRKGKRMIFEGVLILIVMNFFIVNLLDALFYSLLSLLP